MSLDPAALAAALAAHGPLVRVVVAAVRGSAPREPGAAMLVWAGGQQGTIGGGALEWQAAAAARSLLARTDPQETAPGTGTGMGSEILRLPLGPGLGQCCGGAVTLVLERLTPARLADWQARVQGGRLTRPVGPAPPDPPPAIARMQGAGAGLLLQGAWLSEPLAPPGLPVWVHGAGHVGRALAAVLAPLPQFAVTLVDIAPERLPDPRPAGVAVHLAPDPAAAIAQAPRHAHHLVMTHDHARDLALCHLLLGQGCGGPGAGALGLIGSATKAARFRTRLRALGHSEGVIARLACPIGDPGLGKQPQAIAIGVAAGLLQGTAMLHSQGACRA